jgi:glycosyltransferase involved in cell wall biosynthesis
MIVDADCGQKVTPGRREAMISSLADAIGALQDRRQQWASIELAAIERAKEFSWDRVAEELHQAYQESLEKRPSS